MADRPLLKFTFLSTLEPKEAAASNNYGIGQQITRIQKYTESLEQRRRGLMDEFLQYVNTIISGLYVDIDHARINFQDYLSSLDARFLALVKEPGIRPQTMNTTLHTITTEALDVFTKLQKKSDKFATMLRAVITDAVKTLSVGLKDTCCTEAEILSYISEIVHQTEERMNGACATLLTFVEASRNRTLASIEDGRSLCCRVIYQKKVELVCDFVEQYLSFIHHEHEFSPTIMEAIHAVNHTFQQFSADLLNFIAGLSIKTEHPRDMAVRLVKEVLLPHKQKIHFLMEEVRQSIDDVHSSLAESNNEVIDSLEQLSILDEDLNSLIVETLSYWSRRWNNRLTLLQETATRVLHANSFFIACLVAIFGAADVAIKHTTALEDKWRRLCDETMKAVEERFTRDWGRSITCLEYINTNVANVWEVSEAKQVKKISGELLEALEEAIVRRERHIFEMTGPSPADNVVLSTLLDIVSLEVKEASFLTLLGTVADQDAKLLDNTTLFNDTLLKSPMESITPHELTDHNSILLHKISYPDTVVDTWSCADYPIQTFDNLIEERSTDLKLISKLAAAKEALCEAPKSAGDNPEEALKKQSSQNQTPARSTSKKSSRTATPNADRNRAVSKGKAAPEPVTESSGPAFLIDLPSFERDVNLAAYRHAYGFSYFQDGSNLVDFITEMEQRFSAEPVAKEKGKQSAQAAEKKCTVLDLVTPGYQQVMFSEEISYDNTYACVFITLPLDLRLVFYHALFRLLYADGERIAYNKAVSDFKERINSYRTEYLEKLNAATTEAHRAALAEWEKEAAKKTKAPSKAKQTSSRPESRQEESKDADRPSTPEPITQLPDYVEEAIARIQIPAERSLDEREIYIRLVYAVLDFDHLKVIPLTPGQEYPVPTNPALIPPSSQPPPPAKDPKKAAAQPPPKPLLLKTYEKPAELKEFEQIIANPKYSISVDEILFDSCIYEGTRETLERLTRMALALKPQVTRPNTSSITTKRPSSKSPTGDRQASSKLPAGGAGAGPGGEQSVEALTKQRIDKLLTLARPDMSPTSALSKSANLSASKPIIKDTPSQLKAAPSLVSPLGVLGASSTQPSQHGVSTPADIFTDCRMCTSSNSLTIKLVLGNISSSILTIIMSRFVKTYSRILSSSIDNKRRILTISDDLRASLVPYSVRLLHTEVAQIESRCSRYIGIEYRVLNRALSIMTTLRKRILDAELPLAAAAGGAPSPAGSRSASAGAGAGGARAASRGKQAPAQPGESRHYQDALASLAHKGLDRFVSFTFDLQRGIISSVHTTKQLAELHPLFRHTADIYAEKFDKAVNENITLFPEQADRIVGYACDAFIAECKVFFKKNLSTLALNDISSGERIACSFSKQAAGWSGLDNIGPFDFTVADLPVALLRNNYDEVKPLLDAASGPVGVHPAIAVAESLISTIHMLREELYSRLVTDLSFFKFLMANVSKAIRLANTEYNLKKSKIDTVKQKCNSIKTMALNRLFFFIEKMNSLDATFTQAAKCPNRLSLNTLFSNALLAVKSSFELEQIAYYLSYSVDLRFIFYNTDLSQIDQRHTYMPSYDLFRQRARAFHTFSGILLGVISSTINALCTTKALQAPFSFQEEVRERSRSPFSRTPSRRGSSPKRLTKKDTKLVSRTVDLQSIDVYEQGHANFSQLQQYVPRQTTYKPGAKVFYENSVECDIGSQLQTELGAMLATYSTFQPVYVPSEEELARVKLSGIEGHKPNDIEVASTEEPPQKDVHSSRPDSAMSMQSMSLQQTTKQVVLPATTIKRLTDSMFPDEFALLQHYYQESYRDITNLTEDARKQLTALLARRDQLFETIIKQFIASAFEIAYQTIEQIWKTYSLEHKANNTALSQNAAKVYDEFRPMLVKFPEKATSMQTTVKESISNYLAANQLIRDSLRKDFQIILTITNCLLITAPAILLSLYPSWASDTRMAYCASLQLSELLDFMCLSSNKSDGPSKGQAPAKKQPGSGAKTEPAAPAESDGSHNLLKLLSDETRTKTLADSCTLPEGNMVSCSQAFVQTLQSIEASMNAGRTVFEMEDTKALSTASSDQTGASAAAGKAREQVGFLSSAILPHNGVDFSILDTTQLETLVHTLMGKDALITELPILDKLTHAHLDEITLKLLVHSQQSEVTQQTAANKGKAKGKPLAESKKAPGGGPGTDELIPPPLVYYKMSHVALPLASGVEDGLEDEIFTHLPSRIQALVGCSHRALKILLKSLKNAQRLNGLVAEHLKEAAAMEQEASADLERMKDEFKRTFQLLNNPNLMNFTV